VREFAESFDATSQSWHIVQFYDSDAFLVGAIARFAGAALRAGEPLVVIATREHLDALREPLEGFGLDAAVVEGSAVLLDAHATLEQFMVEGFPDRTRLRAAVEETLRGCTSAARDARRICAFGEMVNLLWKDGLKDAAIRLEELWCELCRERRFSLLCAYDLAGFAGVDDTTRVGDVCARHDHVIPAEGYAGIDDPEARAREVVGLQQRARALELEVQKRKELEHALRQSMREQRRAEHTSRVRDHLLAAVGQELRLPLKAISGWTALLRSGHDIDVAEAAETIELSARTQERLLDDIADASRVVGGTLRIRPGPVDLAFVLRASVEAVAHAALMKGLTVEVQIDSDPCLAHADVHRVEQVFSSLLSNAIQFTPEGGRIGARLSRTEDEVELVVQDSGRGISDAALPFVFERLGRADARPASGEGLRLGLAVARHLVELHGGTIEAHSAGVDRGSTFRVRLPRRAVLRDVG
jgi:signal transduction histidine kinase